MATKIGGSGNVDRLNDYDVRIGRASSKQRQVESCLELFEVINKTNQTEESETEENTPEEKSIGLDKAC